MVFIGYHLTGAYKLYNPIEDKVQISRDVIVLENESWNWKEMTTSLRRLIPEMSDEDIVSERENVMTCDSDAIISQRSQRVRTLPNRFSDYELLHDSQIDEEGDLIHLALMVEAEPISEEEALQDSVWKKAVAEELRSIEKNQIWNLIDLPEGKH
ncbi:hypothetical protein TanjilG_12250 [Lupinus angustifolius]|uniref:Retroviral polymerase SH3-like domain-containing protein n=1 Tax=Lupinus angustifolius TaxID=3871 RepID=A0A1J7GKC2_LUPAN|nr:hypothetical protein TanjilG_12250 [Lupinus angustifolius]